MHTGAAVLLASSSPAPIPHLKFPSSVSVQSFQWYLFLGLVHRIDDGVDDRRIRELPDGLQSAIAKTSNCRAKLCFDGVTRKQSLAGRCKDRVWR